MEEKPELHSRHDRDDAKLITGHQLAGETMMTRCDTCAYHYRTA